MCSCFHSLYLTLLFLTGTPENRPRCLSCEETCEEDAYDHVKACTSPRMSGKFLHFVIINSGNKGFLYQNDRPNHCPVCQPFYQVIDTPTDLCLTDGLTDRRTDRQTD